MIILELKNNEEYALYDNVCLMSNLIKTMYYEEDYNLKYGESKQLEKFDLKWAEQDIVIKYEEICNAVISEKSTEELYNILDYNDVNIIFKVLNMANFLHNEKIIQLIDSKITQDITDMSILKVKEKFCLTDEDLSEEVKNQIESLRNVSMFRESDGDYSDNEVD
jgi:hypothetical protein